MIDIINILAAGGMVQVVKCLPSKCKAQISNPRTKKKILQTVLFCDQVRIKGQDGIVSTKTVFW
jgi:hypothetical protein